MTLPPLPEKFDWTVRIGGHGGMIDVEVYSADQMRAYAEQAVAAERERMHAPELLEALQRFEDFARAIERAHGIGAKP